MVGTPQQQEEIRRAGGLVAWFKLLKAQRARGGPARFPNRTPNPRPPKDDTLYHNIINEHAPWKLSQYPGKIKVFAFLAGIKWTTARRVLYGAPEKYPSRPMLRRLLLIAEAKATAWASIAAELRQVLASRERSSRNPAAERRRTRDPAHTAPAKNHTAPANEPPAVQHK